MNNNSKTKATKSSQSSNEATSNIIHVGEERWRKEKQLSIEELKLRKGGNAFAVFAACSAHGKSRQLRLLYKILHRYHVCEPISLDDMTDLIITYLRKNERYFTRKRRRSMKFDFDKEFEYDDRMRLIGITKVAPRTSEK